MILFSKICRKGWFRKSLSNLVGKLYDSEWSKMAQKYVENYETIVVRKSDTYVQEKGGFRKKQQ
jgi:hypothetical protein